MKSFTVIYLTASLSPRLQSFVDHSLRHFLDLITRFLPKVFFIRLAMACLITGNFLAIAARVGRFGLSTIFLSSEIYVSLNTLRLPNLLIFGLTSGGFSFLFLILYIKGLFTLMFFFLKF